jgi:Domain of Unknown Function (DUF928)
MKLVLYSLTASAIAISSLLVLTSIVAAEPSPSELDSALRASNLQAHYKPDQPQGAGKGRSKGTASRGDCLKSDNGLPLIALSPTHLVATMTERPTLWFYIPYALTAESSVAFSIRKNDDLNTKPQSFDVRIPNGTTPGVIHVQTPISLELRQSYRWTLAVSCQNGSSEEPDQADVHGFIKRIEPSVQLTAQLRRQFNPRQQAVIYAEQGLWFDGLNRFAELRRSRPQDPQLRNDWQRMLKQAGVEEVSDMPLRSCCTLRSK